MNAKPLTDAWFEEHRHLSIMWAKTTLALCEAETEGQEFVILDTESTGLGAGAEPVQITVLGWNGEPLLNTHVKPGCAIEPGAARIHGLTADKLRLAPTFKQILPTFQAAVSGRTVLAFNLEFDRRLIRQTVEKYHLEPPRAAGYDCVMLRYAAFYGDWNHNKKSFRWQSLSNACEQMGIIRKGSHESLVDCIATLELIQHMALIDNAKV